MNFVAAPILQELFPGIEQFSYASIFNHFKYNQKAGQPSNSYSIIGRTYQVYRVSETGFTCFNVQSLKELSKPELLIELSGSNDLQELQ
jgi:hypothetical protein